MGAFFLGIFSWHRCDHLICPGLSILFLYTPAHKARIFENFVIELEAFSCDFEIGCMMFQLISLNNKMVVSSGEFNFSFHDLRSVLF